MVYRIGSFWDGRRRSLQQLTSSVNGNKINTADEMLAKWPVDETAQFESGATASKFPSVLLFKFLALTTEAVVVVRTSTASDGYR
ncbi:hypothetical protein J6590_092992 [Homalodisca vitripennis]|nr:hypothetical protein J6590_092992 [Homalodisca vitripennis]